MKRAALGLGCVLVALGWLFAVGDHGMIGHMASHMIAVALAPPLLVCGLTGTALDPARRWPRAVTPVAMMLVELVTVWLWHVPALRESMRGSAALMAFEQLSFLAAGILLWFSVMATPQRAAGVGALLLTSMHMTLLGALIGLAPRPLYSLHHSIGMDPMEDQQLGGVIMLLVGGASYLTGGLYLLGGLLREKTGARA